MKNVIFTGSFKIHSPHSNQGLAWPVAWTPGLAPFSPAQSLRNFKLGKASKKCRLPRSPLAWDPQFHEQSWKRVKDFAVPSIDWKMWKEWLTLRSIVYSLGDLGSKTLSPFGGFFFPIRSHDHRGGLV